MKMWKRLLGLFVAVMMILPSGMAFAEDERVEITFCVGDETLLINGEAVTVEKPYVVGEGVTLVPLRVITEAFGATVDWEDATQSITLTYPGVSILLQIGNSIAEVNGKAETLLAAPELPTSFTMVPLRFISENFGATVSYDEETEKITVVKESAENGGLLTGGVESKYIGDSYYNWNMENPVDMQMVDRDFDGTYTSFENEYGYLEILVEMTDKDYDFEKDFAEGKASFLGATLIKAEKDTKNSARKTMYFQARTKESHCSVKKIVTNKYIYTIYGIYDLEATEEKEEAIRIMDTFALGFREEDIHDLSNVQDGVRLFADEELNFELAIPQDYIQIVSESEVNVFRFVPFSPEDTISQIAFGIYSKSEVGDAKSMAEGDYLRNKENSNEKIVTFSKEVSAGSYGELSVYEYESTARKTVGEEYMRDIFFELGEYTYNLAVYVKMPKEDVDAYIAGVVAGLSFEQIDPNRAGILMRNLPEANEETFAVTFGDGIVQVPVSYQEQSVAGVDAFLYNIYNGVGLSLQKVDATQWGEPSVHDEVKRLEAKFAIQEKNEILESTAVKSIGKHSFAVFSYRTTEDGETSYFQVYGMLRKGDLYLAYVGYPELAYSEKNRQEIVNILKTLTFEKS